MTFLGATVEKTEKKHWYLLCWRRINPIKRREIVFLWILHPLWLPPRRHLSCCLPKGRRIIKFKRTHNNSIFCHDNLLISITHLARHSEVKCVHITHNFFEWMWLFKETAGKWLGSALSCPDAVVTPHDHSKKLMTSRLAPSPWGTPLPPYLPCLSFPYLTGWRTLTNAFADLFWEAVELYL